MTDSDVYRARVRNRAKLAYNSVAAWLDGKAADPAAHRRRAGDGQQIRIQDQVAQAMERVRHEHGALTLETIEARAVFDRGVLSDCVPTSAIAPRT